MARLNPRKRIDQQAQEATRALADHRDVVLPNEHALTEAARVRRSDVDRAVSFFREAVAGSGFEDLLDGPAREDERV